MKHLFILLFIFSVFAPTTTLASEYDDIYFEGYEAGYSEGKLDGEFESYGEGYDDGYFEGYEEGYAEAEKKCDGFDFRSMYAGIILSAAFYHIFISNK